MIAAFFAWNGLAGVWSLLDSAEPVLSPQGFEVKGWRPGALIPWSDVEEFSVTGPGLGKFVSCTLTPEAEDRFRLGKRLMFGVEKTGFIPPRLEQSSDYVRRILEDWRRAHA